MNWKTVEDKIAQDNENNWDRKALGCELRVSEAGTLEVLNGERDGSHFSLSELATTQMCQKLEVPVKYYRRLSDDMKATVANYDIKRFNGHSYLLRGKGDWIRAFLSNEYVAYNNSEIAETVEGLLARGEVTVKDFVLEETNMFMKIISEDIWDVESGLKAGIVIGNSEVGMGSVSVEPFVFRKPCTNDLIVSQEKTFRHAHIHLTEYEMRRRMAEAISQGFTLSRSILNAFLKSRDEPIEDPVQTIRNIAEARNLSQKLTDEVVCSYLTEPEANRFGVINALPMPPNGWLPCSGSRWKVCRHPLGSSPTIVLFLSIQASKRLPFFFWHGVLPALWNFTEASINTF